MGGASRWWLKSEMSTQVYYFSIGMSILTFPGFHSGSGLHSNFFFRESIKKFKSGCSCTIWKNFISGDGIVNPHSLLKAYF